MSGQNPWALLPHEIYEKHMGHGHVRQLQLLSRITGEQLELVAGIRQPVVAFLGITGGNGLESLPKGACKAILGLDINAEYLDVCRERYGYLSELKLYQIDLMTEKDRAAVILQGAHLVTANLVVNHIHLDNFLELMNRLVGAVVSVVIQVNPDGRAVSQSGYEAEFTQIALHGQDCGEAALTYSMLSIGYALFGRQAYSLPNQKVLIRLDYKRANSQGEAAL